MRVIQIEQTERNLEKAIQNLIIVEKPIPKPGPGQVLVKIEAAPCNPSDLLFIQGKYGVKKTMPAVPGWEGAGIVVESGGGPMAWWLKGKRVACGGQNDRDGTWAEYTIADAKSCIPLSDKVSSEQGATLLINPLTAVGLVEQRASEGHKGIIQTAACSQVGRMVQIICRKKGIPLINIVRREEQVKQLKDEGAEFVLNSENEDFYDELKKLAKTLKATIVLEAIAGEITGKILSALPENGKAIVYGALSEKNCSEISPLSLIFEKKKVEGFWLKEWIQNSGFFSLVKTTQFLQKMIEKEEFATKIAARVGFEEWKNALLDYSSQMTKGKVLLVPEN